MKHTQDSTETEAPRAAPEARLVGSDRVLAVLKEVARHPDGIRLDELTRAMASPKSTVHRALASLSRADLVDQDERGRYLLGDEFLRIAFAHHEARPDHVRVHPVLEALARRFGETAHYAVLDGRDVVYRAKADPPSGAARLTSTVGGRNPAHATGVGKLLLSLRLDTLAAVEEWIGAVPLRRRTPRTLCTAAELHRDFGATRERGYAVDDQESETGVCCIALPVYTDSPSLPSGAVSVSALTYRTPLERLAASVEEIRELLGPLGKGNR
ncbi:IclR family transcriptional regulator [Glycomyces salinus]|uniref:IclR family transcriptional regulator n=1 Tax=Glycomyces salinus TaxID=980294 RepID=UPI0018EAB3FC|nr:IclR family transcriptional regulator [Glycomyces salinus]